MKKSMTLLLALLCMCIASAAEPTTDEAVRIRLQVFRVNGAMSGDTSIQPNFWMDPPEERIKVEKKVTLFTGAQLRIGEHRLSATQDEWRWDGKPIEMGWAKDGDLPTDQIVQVANPTLLIGKSKGKVSIQSDQPFEYFEKRPDGLYERKTLRAETGLEVEVQAIREKDGAIRFDEFAVTLRAVSRREPLEGVGLDVGRPILETVTCNTRIRALSGRNYGFLLHPAGGSGLLLLRLQADLRQDESNAPDAKAQSKGE